MKITDKKIEDLRCYKCKTECSSIKYCREQIKQMGYEVEEPQSSLEIAREYYATMGIMNCGGIEAFRCRDVGVLVNHYEIVIHKLQEQIKKVKACYNCKFSKRAEGEYPCANCFRCGKWELKE
jgi:hypothetical protein